MSILETVTRKRNAATVKSGETAENERKENEVRASVTSGHLKPTPELYTFGGIKLGWVQGVVVPCLLNIWGVMLFLRISWIVGQAGIGLTILIILISAVVCIITTTSLSAICTNGQLEGGGVYYLVSRSLGAELGGSVGIIFAFANAVAASMNTIGFCDSLNELLRSHGVKILDNASNDTRIVGTFTILVMCIICAIGMDWESKVQNLLIVVIVAAILDFGIGVCIGPMNDKEIARGFVGISLKTAQENWSNDYRVYDGVQYNFISIFAMYFPSVTGIQSGANICGDLRNPATAIPKGTFLAIAISTMSYLGMAVFSGSGGLRDASGNTSNLTHSALASCKPNCPYGLHTDFEIVQVMALWAPLIYAGCWAATLSTALTNLLSVPRLIQALGTDRIYPGLIFFSKRYGRHGEPYRGYVLTFLVSSSFLLIADLNTVAPLISNFYLASYALINFCTFHASYVDPISWRPTFRSYNKWLSLLGFLMCLGIMTVISWVMALVTTLIFIALYLLVIYTKPAANWGSSTEAQRYQDTVTTILHLSRTVDSIKSYKPQVLVLAGKPHSRPALLDIGHLITKLGSYMIVADIEPRELSPEDRKERMLLGDDWIRARKERSFYVLLNGFDLERGMLALSQSAGLGRLSPNILLIGFKHRWIQSSIETTSRYVRVLQLAFEEQMALAVLRPGRRHTASRPPSRPSSPAQSQNKESSPTSSTVRAHPSTEMVAHTELLALMHSSSTISVDDDIYRSQPSTSAPEHVKNQDVPDASIGHAPVDPRRTIKAGYEPLSFDAKQTIDAWWLYDDGGMNILLPYIIARRGFKEKRSFRIFALTRRGKEDAQHYIKMLLAKFRIEYNELIIIRGIGNPPNEASWQVFHKVAGLFKTNEAASDVLITETEFKDQYAKTCRHLRLRELLQEHSSGAAFIVMSLPIPRKGQISACLYMTWLEVMSQDLPPILFVRGNETVVLDT